MTVWQVLSLLSAILMTAALWISDKVYLESNTCFILQIIAYLFLAVSSWLAGTRSAAFVLVICAATLFLKMIRKYPMPVMKVFLLITLAGGLLINNQGWAGIPVILASLGVVWRYTYQYKQHLPLMFFPKDMWDEVIQDSRIVLSQMDNANRQRSHALDLFMENVVGTALWGLSAWLTRDYSQLVYRGMALMVNLVDYSKRVWPVLSGVLCDMLPNPGSSKRKRMPGRKKKRNWYI